MWYWVALVFGVLALAGCGGGLSESDVEEQLRSELGRGKVTCIDQGDRKFNCDVAYGDGTTDAYRASCNDDGECIFDARGESY